MPIPGPPFQFQFLVGKPTVSGRAGLPFKGAAMQTKPKRYFDQAAANPFDGDISGQGGLATVVGSPSRVASLTLDPGNQATSLNGTTQYIASDSLWANPFGAGLARTFACWIARQSGDSGGAIFAGHDTATCPRLAFSTTTDTLVWEADISAGTSVSWANTGILADGGRHFVVLVAVGGIGAELYVDGRSLGVQVLVTQYNASPGLLSFGAASQPETNFLKATLDEALAWDRSLTATEVYELYVAGVALEQVFLDESDAISTATLQDLTFETAVALDQSDAISTGTLSVTAPVVVPLGSSDAQSAATLALTAPATVVLGASAALAAPTLALTAKTTVALGTSVATSTGALAMTAPATVILSTAAASSTNSLALTAPAVVVLATSAASSTATLAITAPTTVTLGAAAATASPTLALTAKTTVALNASAAQSAATLALNAPAIVVLGASAATSTASLAVTIPSAAVEIPLDPSAATSSATLALTASTRVVLGASAAQSASTLALTAPALLTLTSAASSSASMTLTASPTFTLTSAALSTTSLNVSALTQIPLGSAAATSTAALAIRAQTAIPLQTSAAASTASLALTAPAIVALQTSSGQSTASLAVTAQTTVALQSSVAQSAATLALTTATVPTIALASAGQSTATLATTAATQVVLNASAATLTSSLALNAPATVVLGASAATSAASLALTAPAIIGLSVSSVSSASLVLATPTPVPLNASAAASTASLALTAKTTVALGTSAAVTTTSLALTAPTKAPLGAAVATSSATLALNAPTQVPLNASAAASTASLDLSTATVPTIALTSGGVSTSTLALKATAIVVLDALPSTLSTATLALTIGAKYVLLNASTGQSAATAALTAKTTVALTSAGQSSSTLALKAATRVPLQASAGQSTASLALSGPTLVGLGSSAGQSTATLALRAPTAIPLGTSAGQSAATLKLGPVTVALGASAAQSAATVVLATRVPMLYYGIADDELAYEDPVLVARAAATNATAARILVGHDDVGAPGPTAAINAIEAAGMQAIVCLWTVTDFTDHSPSDPAGYYAGRVTAALAAWPNVLIECFNEPNLTAAFIPGYEFTLASAAACVTAAVDAAGPGKVIGPAIATLPDETTYLQYQDDLYYYIYAMGGLADLHGIATHIYPSAPYPAATPLTDGLFQYARHIERTAVWGKPIYVTETGFQAGVYGASQDAFTVWGWSYYLHDPRVAGYFVYRLYPDPGDIQQMSISDNVSLRDALTTAWATPEAIPVDGPVLDLTWDVRTPVEYVGPIPAPDLYPGEPPQYPGAGLGIKWNVNSGVAVPVDGNVLDLPWDVYVPVEYTGPIPASDLYPAEPPQYPGAGLGIKWNVDSGVAIPVDGPVLDLQWDLYVPVDYLGPIPAPDLYPGEPPEYPGIGLGLKWDVGSGVVVPVDGGVLDLTWDVYVPVDQLGPVPGGTIYPGEPLLYPGLGFAFQWDVDAQPAQPMTLVWDLLITTLELTHPDLGGVVNEVRAGGAVNEVRAGGVVNEVRAGGVVNEVRTGATVNEVRTGGSFDGVRTGATVNEVRTGGVVNEVRTGGTFDQVITGGEVTESAETVIGDGLFPTFYPSTATYLVAAVGGPSTGLSLGGVVSEVRTGGVVTEVRTGGDVLEDSPDEDDRSGTYDLVLTGGEVL